jgi:parvulin-like peptidyl-prolyl isomerase
MLGFALAVASRSSASEHFIHINQQSLPLSEFNRSLRQAVLLHAQSQEILNLNPLSEQIIAYRLRHELLDEMVERVLLAQQAQKLNVTLPATADLLNMESDAYASLRSTVKSRVAGPVRLTRQSLLDFYKHNQAHFKIPERIKVRQILLADENSAQTVYNQILLGHDFAQMAELYSQDKDTRNLGGSVGLVDFDYYHPHVSRILFALPNGGISPIIRSDEGYGIFMVDYHFAEEVAPFDLIRRDIEKYLENETQEENYRAWLSQQKASARIKLPSDFFPPLRLDVPGFKPSAPMFGVDCPELKIARG